MSLQFGLSGMIELKANFEFKNNFIMIEQKKR